MTRAEIEADIATQKEIIALCNEQIKALIVSKRNYNTSTGQTQLMVTNQSISDLRREKNEAQAEIDTLEALLDGGTIQVTC
jgi:hypothetical protein